MTSYSGWLMVSGSEITSTGEAVPLHNPGALASVDGKLYKYVKFDNGSGNVAPLVGGVVYWLDAANFVVTSDQSDAGQLNDIAGVLVSELKDGHFGWILVNGFYPAVLTTGGAAAVDGCTLIGSVTDLRCGCVAPGTAPAHKPIGWGMGALGAGNIIPAYIDCL